MEVPDDNKKISPSFHKNKVQKMEASLYGKILKSAKKKCKVIPLHYRKNSSVNVSFSSLCQASGACKLRIKNLLKNNKSLARTLETARCELTAKENVLKNYAKDMHNMMLARIKVEEMTKSLKKILSDFEETAELLESCTSFQLPDLRQNNQHIYDFKNKMKQRNVEPVEEDVAENDVDSLLLNVNHRKEETSKEIAFDLAQCSSEGIEDDSNKLLNTKIGLSVANNNDVPKGMEEEQIVKKNSVPLPDTVQSVESPSTPKLDIHPLEHCVVVIEKTVDMKLQCDEDKRCEINTPTVKKSQTVIKLPNFGTPKIKSLSKIPRIVDVLNKNKKELVARKLQTELEKNQNEASTVHDDCVNVGELDFDRRKTFVVTNIDEQFSEFNSGFDKRKTFFVKNIIGNSDKFEPESDQSEAFDNKTKEKSDENRHNRRVTFSIANSRHSPIANKRETFCVKKIDENNKEVLSGSDSHSQASAFISHSEPIAETNLISVAEIDSCSSSEIVKPMETDINENLELIVPALSDTILNDNVNYEGSFISENSKNNPKSAVMGHKVLDEILLKNNASDSPYDDDVQVIMDSRGELLYAEEEIFNVRRSRRRRPYVEITDSSSDSDDSVFVTNFSAEEPTSFFKPTPQRKCIKKNKVTKFVFQTDNRKKMKNQHYAVESKNQVALNVLASEALNRNCYVRIDRLSDEDIKRLTSLSVNSNTCNSVAENVFQEASFSKCEKKNWSDSVNLESCKDRKRKYGKNKGPLGKKVKTFKEDKKIANGSIELGVISANEVVESRKVTSLTTEELFRSSSENNVHQNYNSVIPLNIVHEQREKSVISQKCEENNNDSEANLHELVVKSKCESKTVKLTKEATVIIDSSEVSAFINEVASETKVNSNKIEDNVIKTVTTTDPIFTAEFSKNNLDILKSQDIHSSGTSCKSNKKTGKTKSGAGSKSKNNKKQHISKKDAVVLDENTFSFKENVEKAKNENSDKILSNLHHIIVHASKNNTSDGKHNIASNWEDIEVLSINEEAISFKEFKNKCLSENTKNIKNQSHKYSKSKAATSAISRNFVANSSQNIPSKSRRNFNKRLIKENETKTVSANMPTNTIIVHAEVHEPPVSYRTECNFIDNEMTCANNILPALKLNNILKFEEQRKVESINDENEYTDSVVQKITTNSALDVPVSNGAFTSSSKLMEDILHENNVKDLNLEENLEIDNVEGGRRKRKPVSYKEPSLHVKMRR